MTHLFKTCCQEIKGSKYTFDYTHEMMHTLDRCTLKWCNNSHRICAFTRNLHVFHPFHSYTKIYIRFFCQRDARGDPTVQRILQWRMDLHPKLRDLQ